MADLKLTYENIYDKVGEFMGQSSPSAAEIVKHKNITLRGYRRFLMPLDLSSGKVHRWKFLEKTTTLSTQEDKDTYKLPAGFSSFVTTFTHTTPTTWNPAQKPLSFIYGRKSQTTGTGYPVYFALKDGDYDTINGQRYEVVFSPTPSGSFDYYYTYIFTPAAPVNDDDVFVGDAMVSEAIMQSAIAVAELEKDKVIGVHAQEAERLTQMLIGKDKRDGLVPNLGLMTNGKAGITVSYSEVLDQDGTRILPE